ncbi:N-acetylmuramic acid 6-phosphate etherase [Patescibacteria group bacterium]|nr:N-acetylmuramic acid 6-phosphate etherase [Patescibacteria group bacterium]
MATKTTETASNYDDLEKMSLTDLLTNINKEDKTLADCVEKVIPQIEKIVEQIVEKLKIGGRLFYLGAGTSGRLGIVDASECPPTFGVQQGLVVGLIAGGDTAIRKSVEFAEDDPEGGWNDLLAHEVSEKDVVIGIAASGTTPYVVGAIQQCNLNNIVTACITCNNDSPLAKEASIPIEIIVGPEFVTGSTRMKAGTAQKLVLNMITTSTMIKLGKVIGNRMVDMQLSNDKLVERGTKMIMDTLSLDYESANALLLKHGSVRRALESNKEK